MMPITARIDTTSAKYADASGNSDRLNRISPYAPTFSRTPASSTEPGRGRLGVRVGQPRVQREQRHLDGERDEEREEQPARRRSPDSCDVLEVAEVERRPGRARSRTASTGTGCATSRNAEPAIVNRKNFTAA